MGICTPCYYLLCSTNPIDSRYFHLQISKQPHKTKEVHLHDWRIPSPRMVLGIYQDVLEIINYVLSHILRIRYSK